MVSTVRIEQGNESHFGQTWSYSLIVTHRIGEDAPKGEWGVSRGACQKQPTYLPAVCGGTGGLQGHATSAPSLHARRRGWACISATMTAILTSIGHEGILVARSKTGRRLYRIPFGAFPAIVRSAAASCGDAATKAP
jgi:hypothetical protein